MIVLDLAQSSDCHSTCDIFIRSHFGLVSDKNMPRGPKPRVCNDNCEGLPDLAKSNDCRSTWQIIVSSSNREKLSLAIYHLSALKKNI